MSSKIKLQKFFTIQHPIVIQIMLQFFCKLVSFNWLSHDLSHKVIAKNKFGNQVWAIDLSIFFSSVCGITTTQVLSVVYWKIEIAVIIKSFYILNGKFPILTVQSMQFLKRNSMSYVDDNK